MNVDMTIGIIGTLFNLCNNRNTPNVVDYYD